MYTGIYAFNNPNPEVWYVEVPKPYTSYVIGIAPIEDAEGLIPDTHTDVHANFHKWFKYMFWWSIVASLTPCFFSCYVSIEETEYKKTAKVFMWSFSFVIISAYLFMYVMGIIWRFSPAAHLACGDDILEDVPKGPLE